MSKLLSMMMSSSGGGGSYILNPIFTQVGTNVVVNPTTGEVSGFTAQPDYNFIYTTYSEIPYFGLDSTNKLIFSYGSDLWGVVIGFGNRWCFNCWNGNFRYTNNQGSTTNLCTITANVRYRLEYSGTSAISWVLYNDETDTQVASGTITSLPSTGNTKIFIGVKKDSWNGYEYQDALENGKIYAGTVIGGQELVIRG